MSPVRYSPAQVALLCSIHADISARPDSYRDGVEYLKSRYNSNTLAAKELAELDVDARPLAELHPVACAIFATQDLLKTLAKHHPHDSAWDKAMLIMAVLLWGGYPENETGVLAVFGPRRDHEHHGRMRIGHRAAADCLRDSEEFGRWMNAVGGAWAKAKPKCRGVAANERSWIIDEDAPSITFPSIPVPTWVKQQVAVEPTRLDAIDGAADKALKGVAGTPEGYLSSQRLAGIHKVSAEPLRRRLERWRFNNAKGWMEVGDSERGPTDPKYLYDARAVKTVIEKLQAKAISRAKTSSKRPTKK